MELPSDFIEKNQHFLKSCILYEVLQKKPIFDSYRNFCDTVGTDAMEYQDFEFWYFRFYQGELDFNYDRSADPEPKTLVDMPVVIMKKITQNLDSIERAPLRYVNHAIKAVADSFPPVMEKIEIVVSDYSMYGTLNNKRFSCVKKGSGSIFRKPNSSEAQETNKCYIEKGIEHLALALKMPKFQANHVSLQFMDETTGRNDFLPAPFNAKKKRKIIEGFSKLINSNKQNYVEIVMMEFNVADLVHFGHLKSFKFRLRIENPVEDVQRIQDIISTFEELESCELEYMGVLNDSPIREFAVALGEEIQTERLAQGEHRTITHRYNIPESNDYLEFNVEEQWYRCIVKIIKVH